MSDVNSITWHGGRGHEDVPISVKLSGYSTREEADWAFDAAQSWLRRDEPQVGERYTHRECGWVVTLERRPLRVIAKFRYVTLYDKEPDHE